MNRLFAGLLAAATCGAGALGCELVAGLETRTLGVGGGDGGADDGGADGAAADVAPDLTACAVPGSGGGKVRVGNLVSAPQKVDFCFRPDATSGFASIKPVFGASGPRCAGAVGYKTVTTTFDLAPGTYEVKVVRAGAACTSEPIATLPSSVVSDQEATAFYLFGDGGAQATLRRFAESKPTQQIASKVRLIHAVPNQGPVDLGIADATKVPAILAATFVKGVAYLGTATPGSSPAGEVDANGYFQRQTSGGRIVFGVAEANATTAMEIGGRKLDAGAGYTVFYAGRGGSNEFPPEIFVCDQAKGQGAQAACADAAAVNFTVDTVNVQLTGAFVVAEQQRRQPAFQAIANLASDVVCVNEIYAQADKDALVAAARANYPYAYTVATDVNTPPTDPRTLDGTVPPARTGAPCAGPRAGKITAALDCIRDECVQPKGSEQGVAIPLPTGCLQEKCVGTIAGLAASPDPADQACWICLLSQYQSYETIERARTLCATDPNAVYSFRGQSSSVILSRYPLAEQEFYNLPSTDWRSGVLKSRVTLDNQAAVDFYCVTTNAVAVECQSRPYTGQYGGANPADCVEAWRNEQRLHVTRVRDWVKDRSSARHAKAVVAGDFYAGPAFGAKIAAVVPENYDVLGNAFAIAVPPGAEPECTLCSTNPLSQGANTRTRHVFLDGIPITQVRSSAAVLTEPIVDYALSDTVKKVPIAQYYGLRSVVRVEP